MGHAEDYHNPRHMCSVQIGPAGIVNIHLVKKIIMMMMLSVISIITTLVLLNSVKCSPISLEWRQSSQWKVWNMFWSGLHSWFLGLMMIIMLQIDPHLSLTLSFNISCSTFSPPMFPQSTLHCTPDLSRESDRDHSSYNWLQSENSVTGQSCSC